ncbi:MAG: aminoacyl-tRNA hydrolase [Spirochaetes bacterium]|nr:aminoacyl-tRNA hydrolase [Spirochaetota bacterium]
MKLIVGFGNPGDKHINNRQNIGFKVIDILANNANIDVRIKKKKSIIGRGKIENEDIVLLKPQTFVNLIGESVLYIASFLRIDVKDIICIFEDSTLEIGDLRIDYMLSQNTHDGVKSMAKALKSDRFAKVRIGVGQPAKGEKMKRYLLKDFTDDEKLILIDVLNKSELAVLDLIDKDIEVVQNKYNPEGAPKIEKRIVRLRKI